MSPTASFVLSHACVYFLFNTYKNNSPTNHYVHSFRTKRDNIILKKVHHFFRGHISKRKKTLALKWLKLRIPKEDLLIALILLFMLSHIALLYVLLPNFINELQISSYQFSYTFAKSIPSSISLDLNTLNSLKRLFFTGYFSIFLIKKELFFSNTPEIPRKKTENRDFCIKLILLTYQNRDLKHYFRMKKGLITSIKPMLSRWQR